MAVARKLGTRLWIMLRNEGDCHEFCCRGQKQQTSGAGSAGMPETRYGATIASRFRNSNLLQNRGLMAELPAPRAVRFSEDHVFGLSLSTISRLLRP